MSESAHTLKQQAEKVELVLMSRHDKSDAMNYVKELIENPAGLILITNEQDQHKSVEDPLKALMLKEIQTNKAFDAVYKKMRPLFSLLKSNIKVVNMNICS